MRRSNFDRNFDRTRGIISVIFGFIIFIKVMMLCLIVYGVYFLFTSDFTLNDIGYAIGSFFNSIGEGLDQ